MSLTLFSKLGLKPQIKQISHNLKSRTSQQSHLQQPMLTCQLAHHNQIQKRIKIVDNDCEIQNSQSNQPSQISSKNELKQSIINSLQHHLDVKNINKNKKKLALITQGKEFNLRSKVSNKVKEQNDQIMTPKFSYFLREEDAELSNPHAQSCNKNGEMMNYQDLTKKSYSKQKGAQNQFKNYQSLFNKNNCSTVKKSNRSHPHKSINSQFSYDNSESAVTVKRPNSALGNHTWHLQQNDNSNHSNPIVGKIQRSKIHNYSRSKRKMNYNVGQQVIKSRIKQSYRYCMGCELAVLQANIWLHQQECKQFISISSISHPSDILNLLHLKIAKIQDNILSNITKIEDQDPYTLKNKSLSLVKQSKIRDRCFRESFTFCQDYEKVMDISRKWDKSIQEINKLRWFTRIAQKLQLLISDEI